MWSALTVLLVAGFLASLRLRIGLPIAVPRPAV
jgi:hypothetical protein